MHLKNLIFLLVFLVAMGFFGRTARKIVNYLRVGKPDGRFDRFDRRINNVLTIAIGQSKILRDRIAGPVHAGIFWGFLVLLTAVGESIAEGVFPGFSLGFLGPVYQGIALVSDLMGAVVLFAVLVALFRRHVSGPERVRNIPRDAQVDATIILVTIAGIMVSMFLQYGSRIALGHGHEIAGSARPISLLVSSFFPNTGGTSLAYEISWWVHILLVLGFLNLLPFSKHFHVLTSIPNVFFSNKGIRNEGDGALKPIDLEDESAEKFGASDVQDLTWKQLFDSYTCTECGRCTSVCPANLTGKPLSPKKIIVDTRARLTEKAPLLVAGVADDPVLSRQLLHDFITPEELWACTTCRACVQECPVMIEHVDEIVDMRRNLVLTEGEFPAELQVLYRNLENNFAPWQFSPSDRDRWADGLDIPRLSDLGSAQGIDFLFWVGCAGSFDARYKKVSVAFARILQRAGISFAILGNEEKCNGDAARRSGNEYLAQSLVKENVETLNRYGVRRVVTACPHCYHSLKKEFPQFGGAYDVVHHSELISTLIETGVLPLDVPRAERVTYHDSCYIGRYNEIYDEPRTAVASIPGVQMLEMERNRDRGFCCGAGGARMFMEEKTGTRVNNERAREAIATGAQTVASACPFCMTMLTDGIKEHSAADRVAVMDIAELVAEAIR